MSAGPVVAIVDDDPSQLELLETILAARRGDWTLVAVHAEESAADALATRLRSLSIEAGPALWLLDHQLAGFTAEPVVAHLREFAPVVVLTGGIDEARAEDCRAAGAIEVAEKPFTVADADALLARCDRIVGSSADGDAGA